MKQKIISLITTAAMVLSLFTALPYSPKTASAADAPIALGEYVYMGAYDADSDGTAEPIKWRCVAFEKVTGTDSSGNPIIDSTDTVTEYQDGYLPLMLADTSLGKKEFDVAGSGGSHSRNSDRERYGSNYWGDSNIRDWLNSADDTVTYTCGNSPSYSGEAGFLTNFTETEKSAMQTVTQKSLLAECDYNALDADKKSGDAIHTYNASFSTVVQNYSTAYSEHVADTMFLLDVQQLYNVYSNDTSLGNSSYYKLSSDYRLRSPHAGYSYNVLNVNSNNGYVNAIYAYSGVGVRPAFFLNPSSADFAGGKGTSSVPYTFNSSLMHIVEHDALIHHEKVPATLTTDGTLEYWECDTCGKKFSDEAGIYEITDTIILAGVHLGDYVYMGAYDANGDGTAEPIKWRCVAFEKVTGTDSSGNPIIDSTNTVTEYQDGYLPLMLADASLCNKEFDAKGSVDTGSHGRNSNRETGGSNYWSDSNIRDWLNSADDTVTYTCGNSPSYSGEAGFLTNFTETEKSAMQTVTQKSLLATVDYNALDASKKSGSAVLTYNGSISTVVQNYSMAYSEQVADTMFLLDVQQIYNVYSNDTSLGSNSYYTLSSIYWLRSPHASFNSNVRYVNSTGSVGNGSAYNGDYGVRPAFFLNPSSAEEFLSGDGKKDTPYSFDFSGEGTEQSPYEIPDLKTLEAFRDKVNGGENYEGKYFKLTADIDMSGTYSASTGKSWEPIGDSSHKFKGSFDGGNHTISGLYINTSGTYNGLFACVGSSSAISNLGVDGTINAGTYVGGICSRSEGKITNCYNNCVISGSGQVGGVCGINTTCGVITNCYNTAAITSKAVQVGGVCGSSSGTIINCYNMGTVSGSTNYVGGVCGYSSNGTITNVYNTGTVSGVNNVGGVCGVTAVTITNAYNTGAVSGTDGVGGVCGNSSSTITNCYYLKTDSLNNGLDAIGSDSGTVTNCDSKTAAEFTSGEVAYLLQNGQDTQDTLVWGQALTDTKDAYPILTNESAKKVYKVTFNVTDSTSDSGYKEHAAAYANYSGTVALPTVPTSDIYAFMKWSQTENTDGTEFTAETPVTADIIVYAVGEVMYGETENEKTVTTTYGTATEKDLSEYIAMADESTTAADKFTYEITSTAVSGISISDNKLIVANTTAANESGYGVTIKATKQKSGISLMSVDFGTENTITFNVTIKVNKAASSVTTAPQAVNNLVYNTNAQALVTAGTAAGGTLNYSLNGTDYSADIPTGTDAKEYTVYYKVVGDGNHNDTAAQSVTVTIAQADGTASVTMNGWTYGATASNPVPTSTTNGTSNVTYQYKAKDAADSTYTADKPSSAGSYTVKATFAATQNYKEVTATADFTIAQATPTLEQPTPAAVTYGTKLSEISLSDNWAWDNGETLPTVTNSGYTAYYTVSDYSNYNWNGIEGYNGTTHKVTRTITVTVNPKAVTADMISNIENQTYTGSAIEPTITVTDSAATITADDYDISYENNTNVGTATVTIAGKGNYTGTASRDFEIVQAGSSTTVTGNSAVTYGETLTLTATVSKAAANSLLGARMSLFSAAQNYVDFYAGETLLGSVEVDYGESNSDSGTATLDVKTTDKKLAVGANTITAEYGGSVNLNGSNSNQITVTLNKKALEYTVAASDREYNGKTAVDVTLTPTNIGNDNISLSAEGTLASANADTYDTISLSNVEMTGTDNGYYTVDTSKENVTLTSSVTINPKSVTADMIANIDNQTYTGSAIEPTITVTDSAAAITANDYDISYSANTNVGTATVTITGKGNYTGTASRDFSIVQAGSSTTVTGDSAVTYGETLTLTATVSKAAANNLLGASMSLFSAAQDYVDFYVGETLLKSVQVNYGTSNSDSGTATLQIDTTEKKLAVGENTITAEYGGSVNLNGSNSNQITVTLNKKEVGLTWSGYTDLVYNGEPKNVTAATGIVDGDGEIGVTVENGNQINADTYTATATGLTGDNAQYYKLPSAVTQEYTIAKATPTVEPPAENELHYTGEEQELVTAGSTTGGELQYKLGDGEYSTAIPKASHVGDYTVYYKVVGDSNYNDVAENSVVVSIDKVRPELTAPTAIENLVYDGTAKLLVENGGATGGTLMYAVVTQGAAAPQDDDYSTDIPTEINAGEYTVYYKVIGDDDHGDIDAQTVKVTIAKAASTVTAPTAIQNLIYNTEPQQLINGGSSEDGVLWYSLSKDGVYSTDIPTGTNADTYTVWYKVVGDSNHNDTEPQSVTVTIAARVFSVTLEVNSGTINSGGIENYTEGTGAILPSDVTRAGYTFGGWYDNADLTGEAVTVITSAESGDKTYYAKWIKVTEYTVIIGDEAITVKIPDTSELAITDGDGNSSVPADTTIIIGDDETLALPENAEIVTGDTSIKLPNGGGLDNEGNTEAETVVIGDTTITAPSGETVTTNKDGNTELPENSTVTVGETTITLPNGGNVDNEGNTTAEQIIVGDTTITAPTGETVTTDKNGNTELPENSTVTVGETTITLPSGGTVDNEGNATAEQIIVDDTTITAPTGETVTTDKDGNTTVPNNSSVTIGDTTITLPNGGTVDDNNNVSGTTIVVGDTTITAPIGETVTTDGDGNTTAPENSSVTVGDTTITLPNGGTVDGEGNTTAETIIVGDTTITAPTGETVTADKNGNTELPDNSTVTVGDTTITLPNGGTVDSENNVSGETIVIGDTTLTAPTGETVTADKNGNTALPENSTVTVGDTTITLPNGGTVDDAGNTTAETIIVGDTTITAPTGETVTTDKDGNTELPDNSTVTVGETTITLPSGGTVDSEGTTTAETIVVGDTTITAPTGETVTADNSGNTELPDNSTVTIGETIITLPSGGTVDTDSNITLPENGSAVVEDGNERNITITIPESGTITVENGGDVTVPENSTVAIGDTTVTLPSGGAIDNDNKVSGETIVIGDTVITAPTGETVTTDKDGNTELPENSTVTVGDTTITLPSGGTVDNEGTTTAETIIVGDTTITAPTGETVTTDKDGNTELPENSTVTVGDTTITLPNGGTVDNDNNVSGETLVIGDTILTAPTGETVTTNKNGNTALPENSTVTVGETTITLPSGGTVDNEGTTTAEKIVVGDTTITAPIGETVTTDKGGNTNVPDNSTVTVGEKTITLPSGGNVDNEGTTTAETVIVGDTTITAPSGETVTTDKNGNTALPENSTVTVGETTITLPSGGTVDNEGTTTAEKIVVGDTTITAPTGETVTTDKDGNTALPENSTVTVDETTITLPSGGTVDNEGTTTAETIVVGDTTLTAPTGETVTTDKDGNTELPENSTVTVGDATITLPSGGAVDSEGNTTAEKIVVGDTVITAPTGETVTTDKNGNTALPDNSTVTVGDTTITLPSGGTVDSKGTTTAETIVVGDTTITAPSGETVTTDKDGNTELPENSTVVVGDTTITLPSGGTVDNEGTTTAETIVVGDTVITAPTGETVTTDKDGNTALPDNSTVTVGDTTITLPSGGTVDNEGATTAETVIVGNTTITAPTGETVTTDKDGNTALPDNSTVTVGDTTITLPSGGTVDSDGATTAEKIVVGDSTITAPSGETVTTDKDGNTELPDNSTVTVGETTITLPNGGNVDNEGNTTAEQIIVGDTTITAPSGETVTTDKDGNTALPDNSTVTVGDTTITLPSGGTVDNVGTTTAETIVVGDTVITAPTGEKVTTDKDGNKTIPDGGTVKIGDDNEITLPSGGTVDKDANISLPENGKAIITDENGENITITVPSGEKINIDDNGNVGIPSNSTVQVGDNEPTTLTEGGTIDKGGAVAVPVYKVTLETDGGTINSGNITNYSVGTSVTLPTDITKTGYTFNGWYDNAEFTGAAVTEIAADASGDKIFYAKWKKKSSGSSSSGSSSSKTTSTPKPAETPTSTETPTPTTTDEPVKETPIPADTSVQEPTDKSSSAEVSDTNPFVDVQETDWFYGYVQKAYTNGLMSGVSNTEFAPYMDITRGMFVTVLYRMENEPETYNTAVFDDIPTSEYYANAVAWASANGIVYGVSDTEYMPDSVITREQMAAIIYRYAKFKGIDINAEMTLTYIDSDSISVYALDAVKWISADGIMQGDEKSAFNPQDNTRRIEAAIVFERVYEKLK